MQYNCRSLRCSWSIACRRCSNYIFILDLTSGFKGFGKDSRKRARGSFKCWDLVRLILETWRYTVSWNVCNAERSTNNAPLTCTHSHQRPSIDWLCGWFQFDLQHICNQQILKQPYKLVALKHLIKLVTWQAIWFMHGWIVLCWTVTFVVSKLHFSSFNILHVWTG